MDTPSGYSDDAGWQARKAYERAQTKAAQRAHRRASAEERRRQRASARALRAAEVGKSMGTIPSLAAASPGHVVRTTPKRWWALGWWTAFAMLLAWLGSLPLTYAMYRETGESPMWTSHLILGMPTVVSGVALVTFLFTVPAPSPRFRRILRAVLLAPPFLAIGVLVFLFTAGFGSWAFAWFLSRQRTSATAAAEEST